MTIKDVENHFTKVILPTHMATWDLLKVKDMLPWSVTKDISNPQLVSQHWAYIPRSVLICLVKRLAKIRPVPLTWSIAQKGVTWRAILPTYQSEWDISLNDPSFVNGSFDLVMVGIIHKLAEGAAEAATGLNVAKFILVFYPAWSIWTDVRSYINVSGTDDVAQRMYILVTMMLLIGYAANAAGIIIGEPEAEAVGETTEEAAAATGTGGHGEGTVEARAVKAVVGLVGSYLVKRASSESEVEPTYVLEIGQSGFWLASGWHAAIASATGFYLAAKFCRLFLFFIYGLLLPKFRKALWLNMVSLILISCVYLPIIFITDPGLVVILVVAGISLELSSRFLVASAMQILHGRAKHKGHKTYMPAYSLPHLMERMTQFTILVVGEAVMNATFIAVSGEFGPQRMYWRACLSVVIPFLLIWLYFDNDSSRTFVHALKRHWFTSITFTHLHFPLCASLILMSSALVKLIQQEAVEIGYLWFFSGSIATSVLCIGLLGTLHHSLDVWGSSFLPKSARIGVRFVVAAVFAVMPLLHHWKSVEFLGAHAGLLVLCVAFETFGKLGSYGRRYDPVRAEELRKRRKEAYGHADPDDSIPLSDMPNSSPQTEKRHTRRLSTSAVNILDTATRKIHKDYKVKGPSRRASWHEYDDLTGAERGEEDVGIESELGKIESKEMTSGERWAYVAT
jgi:low temperature requirement protein LtrA